MALDKLTPNDTRVQYESAQVRGKTYGYMLGEPDGQPLDTMLLIHGFPDLGFGWRNQIPYFMSLGYRVVVPDMIGYGRTDAPTELEAYVHGSIAADMRELVQQILGKDTPFVIGGHDWGGCIVWDMAKRYPQLIKAVFSVCTPILEDANQDSYEPLEEAIAAGRLTNFHYQLQFMGPDLDTNIQGPEKLTQFFNAVYGGTTPDGEYAVSAETGFILDKLPQVGRGPLVSAEEAAFYTEQYMRNGAPQLRGPLSWYRVRKQNWEDHKQVNESGLDKVTMPALFIAAKKDDALPPSMSEGMERSVVDLTRARVDSSHWALWEAAGEVNEAVGAWLKEVATRV